MKEWFKYEFGFVNIDADNIYLTNTGVWSETQELVNKNIRNGNSNIFRRTQMKVFLILYAVIITTLFLYEKINALGVINSLVAVFLLYQNFSKIFYSNQKH